VSHKQANGESLGERCLARRIDKHLLSKGISAATSRL
jgi:hypothetical protein